MKRNKETRERIDKITIINEIENNLDKKIKEKETVTRYMLYSIKKKIFFGKENWKKKSNISLQNIIIISLIFLME